MYSTNLELTIVLNGFYPCGKKLFCYREITVIDELLIVYHITKDEKLCSKEVVISHKFIVDPAMMSLISVERVFEWTRFPFSPTELSFGPTNLKS